MTKAARCDARPRGARPRGARGRMFASRVRTKAAMRRAGLAVAGALAVAGCDWAPSSAPTKDSAPGWSAIVERGVIRLAGRAWDGFDTLPSQGLAAESYRRLAEAFAARHGLTVEWRVATSITELLALVERGEADVAVANITVTPSRSERVAFSMPLTRSREWVVGASETGTFGVAEGTAYVETLRAEYPDNRRVPVPANAEPSTFIDLIEAGAVDATIMDEAAARVIARASPRISKLRELPTVKTHAWALALTAPELKTKLDEFLLARHVLTDSRDEARDWAAIQKAGRLRMLTVNAPTTYYLWRGELLGFEYELLRGFATRHDLQLEVVVARDIEQTIDWLLSGRGDVIAAGLTPTPERRGRGLEFTSRYLEVRETFVTRGVALGSLADLAGREVVVNPATSYAATLATLAESSAREADFRVRFVDEATQAIMDSVAAGDVDVTLADSHRAELAATFHDNLALGVAFEPRGLAWALRAEHKDLKARLDDYARSGYRGYAFNVLRNKYFVNQRRMVRQRQHRVSGDTLSPYDDLVKAAAGEADVDWRLVIAQMYQESGFDPNTVSFAGAEGLLQVLPRTAREVGVDPARLREPASGIRAGVRYLAWTRERFPDLPVGEQLKFALAAYNAGAGHVRDGRRLARRLELDDSIWFDNVELAMLKLMEPDYARQAAHGYVRGSEVVNYVRQIHDRYRAYLDHFRLLEQGT